MITHANGKPEAEKEENPLISFEDAAHKNPD
jgi:hypothetical protein